MYNSKEFKRSRWAYIAECTLEYFVTIIAGDAILARLLNSLGLGDAETGIITSLTSLAFLFQLCAVPIVRKITNTKLVAVLFHTAGQLCFMLLFLVPLFSFSYQTNKILVMGLVLLAYFGNYFVTSVIYRWGNSFVEPSKLATFSGKKEMVSLLTGVVIQLTSGAAVDRFVGMNNERGAFIFCAVSIFVFSATDLVSLLLIKNEKIKKEDRPDVPFAEVIKNTLGNKGFLSATVLTCLFKAGQYSVVGFLGTYKNNELMMSMLLIQTVNIAACLCRFAVSIPFGKYTDKTSFSKGLQLGFLITASSSLALVFTCPSLWWLIILYSLLYHTSMAGVNANLQNITYSFVDKKYLSEALAIKNAISGLVGFGVAMACGKLLEAVQQSPLFLFDTQIYGQQILGLISLVFIVAAMLFNKLAVGKIRRI